MLSLFKKTALSVAMLGSVVSMHAEEEKKPMLPSSVKTALASAGILAGGLSLIKGYITDTPGGTATSIVGVTLAGASILYLLKSAKGIRAKIRSLWGASNLLIATIPTYIVLSQPFDSFMLGASALLAINGYLVQPEADHDINTEEKDLKTDILHS